MAIPKIGGAPPAPVSHASPVQPARVVAPQQPPPHAQPAGRAPPPVGARLPPPPADVDTSGGGGGGYEREKRDDAYWAAHPLRAGTFTIHWYVNKIMDWGVNGITVSLRGIDWDASINRPGPHHGRPLDWPQNMRAEIIARMSGDSEDAATARRAFAYFRRDLVSNYVSLGRPEETWIKDADGAVVPPWYDFFVHRMPDGVVVPCVLRCRVGVQAKREKFPNLHDMTIVRSPDGSPVQAPMPFEVVPYVAEVHGWRTTETREINVNGRTTDRGFRYDAFTTTVARVDRDAVPLGHLGLRTYKELA